MHDTFRDAPVLGSLINPAKSDAAKLVEWDELSSALDEAMAREQTEEQHEIAIAAQGVAQAATMLAGHYHWVITNVPYLARGKQGETLRDYCGKYYSAAKNDLATVFLDRCLEYCVEGGIASVVLPQNWLFLSSYKMFREKLLQSDTWHLLARLGPGAFETISGEVVKVILVNFRRGNTSCQHGSLFGREKGNLIRGLDVSDLTTPDKKATDLRTGEIKNVEQVKQLDNPDAVVALDDIQSHKLLADYAVGLAGILNGDTARFEACFWEVMDFGIVWEFEQSTVNTTVRFGGRHKVILWEGGDGQLRAFAKGPRQIKSTLLLLARSLLLAAFYLSIKIHPFHTV